MQTVKRKSKEKSKSFLNIPDSQNKPTIDQQDSEDEQGFSKWLRSEEGVENLKLFVLGNSIIVFLALSWPQIKEVLDAVYYLYLEYTQKP